VLQDAEYVADEDEDSWCDTAADFVYLLTNVTHISVNNQQTFVSNDEPSKLVRPVRLLSWWTV